MTDTAPTNRRSYMLHCIRISLLKRWSWLVISALCGLTVAFVLNASMPVMLTATLTLPLLVALLIAVDSWRRHQHD